MSHPPAVYNEIDPYCCKVLRARIADGSLPPGDVDDRDIREVSADDYKGYGQIHLFAGIGGFGYAARLAGLPDGFDILTGGFPCQDISVAGRGEGIGGLRSRLWEEEARLIGELRPRFALVENVSELLDRGLGVVLGSLAKIGYDAEWHCLCASHAGLPHRRDRIWIVTYPGSERGEGEPTPSLQGLYRIPWGENERRAAGFLNRSDLHTPRLCGTGDGIPHRMDRLRGVGNAIVPQVAAEIMRAMKEA